MFFFTDFNEENQDEENVSIYFVKEDFYDVSILNFIFRINCMHRNLKKN